MNRAQQCRERIENFIPIVERDIREHKERLALEGVQFNDIPGSSERAHRGVVKLRFLERQLAEARSGRLLYSKTDSKFQTEHSELISDATYLGVADPA
jgi:hypothetical protein